MSRVITHRVGVIDLGSNSARVIIMAGEPGRHYHLMDEIRVVTRLREGLGPEGLSPSAMTRAFFTLRLFRRFCVAVGVDEIVATATSAVRQAANGPAFLERVKREIGLELMVLSGEREAYYGVLGALNAVPLDRGVVMDIGGGSAQLSRVEEGRFVEGQALPLGALALTERFVTGDPIPDADFNAVAAEIGRQLDRIEWLEPGAGPLVGLGGTIRNVAKMDAARRGYPLDGLNRYRVDRASVARSVRVLRELPVRERESISGLKKDRADIILPGVMGLLETMRRLDVPDVEISSQGLREGLFFEEFWEAADYPVAPDLRGFAILNMGRFYGYAERHAHHVAYLAARLFDELAPIHGYGQAERELLYAAAVLHDLGTVINYADHHKHSRNLIAGNGLPGYTPREVALIALLARYHRRGDPSPDGYETLLIEGDHERLLQLAALLRLAEYLERSRTQLVRDIEVGFDEEDRLVITLIADEFPAIELWDSRRNAVDLLEVAFDHEVRLASSVADESWVDSGRVLGLER